MEALSDDNAKPGDYIPNLLSITASKAMCRCKSKFSNEISIRETSCITRGISDTNH